MKSSPNQSSRLAYPPKLPVLVSGFAALLMLSNSTFAQVTSFLETHTTNSYGDLQVKNAPTAASLDDSLTEQYSFASAQVQYGSANASMTLNTSTYSSNAAGGGVAAIWQDVVTINNSGLVGQDGVAHFTMHLGGKYSGAWTGVGTGSVSYGIHVTGGFNSFNSGGDITDQGLDGTQPAANATFTFDVPFTFGSPFTMKYELTVGSAGNGGQSSSPGSAAISANFTLSSSGFTVLNAQSKPVSFTSISKTGSTRVSKVAANSSLAGFVLANSGPGRLGTKLSLLDGMTTTAKSVQASFVTPPPPATIELASDAAVIAGTGNTIKVVQFNYDPAIAEALFGVGSALRLACLEPITKNWLNSVAGNVGGTPKFFARAYHPATDLHLGNFGLDTANHVAWAVVNFSGEFGVSVVPLTLPEISIEHPAGTDLTDGASTQNFGSVPVGSTKTFTFKIKNHGKAALKNLTVTLDGPNAGNFNITAPLVTTLPPASTTVSSTTFTVIFNPLSKGSLTASIHIHSNDVDESPFDIMLIGTGG